jgi:hypothetical protein
MERRKTCKLCGKPGVWIMDITNPDAKVWVDIPSMEKHICLKKPNAIETAVMKTKPATQVNVQIPLEHSLNRLEQYPNIIRLIDTLIDLDKPLAFHLLVDLFKICDYNALNNNYDATKR